MCDNIEVQDCAVCLQKCHHPTQLPCGHVFCFLCVKGVAIQSKKCAMCRAAIPSDYLDHPMLLEKISPLQGNVEEPLVDNHWYYEGRNGWWKYDERSSIELETAFNTGKTECTLLLAGALYSIDLQNMTQVRCSDPTRRRRVRRDSSLFPAKGVAGIKAVELQSIEQAKADNSSYENSHGEDIVEIADQDDDDVEIIEPTAPEIIAVDDVSDEFEQIIIQESET